MNDRSGLRDAMRVAGPTLLAAGALLFGASVVQFAGAFESASAPQPFDAPPRMPNPLLAFGGLACLGLGGALTRWAFLGPAARYAARETAPAVRIVASAAAEGAGGRQACARCATGNEADARHCKGCGAPLRRSCPACGGASAADARFCDDCGKPLAV